MPSQATAWLFLFLHMRLNLPPVSTFIRGHAPRMFIYREIDLSHGDIAALSPVHTSKIATGTPDIATYPSAGDILDLIGMCKIYVFTTRYVRCRLSCTKVSRSLVTDGCPTSAMAHQPCENCPQIYFGQRTSRNHCPLHRDEGYAGHDTR